MYDHFSLPNEIEKQFTECIRSQQIDNDHMHCFLIKRQSTIKGFHATPEIHNGWVNGAVHRFGSHDGHLFHIHILEFTALVFFSNKPASLASSPYFVPDTGRIWVMRNHGVNQKLDDIAFEFMRERLATEKEPTRSNLPFNPDPTATIL